MAVWINLSYVLILLFSKQRLLTASTSRRLLRDRALPFVLRQALLFFLFYTPQRFVQGEKINWKRRIHPYILLPSRSLRSQARHSSPRLLSPPPGPCVPFFFLSFLGAVPDML
jgi:hypothetical protein